MNKTTATTLWAAFLVSQILMAGVSWFLWDGPDPDATTIVYAMVALIAPMTLMSTVGAGFVVRDEASWFTRLIVRWAFAESIATYGIVVGVSGGPRWLGPAMAAWAFALVLIAFPRQEA